VLMEAVGNIRIEKGAIHIDHAVDFTHQDAAFRSFARAVYKHYGIDYPKFYKMSPLSKLGFLASELLIRDIDLTGIERDKVSLIIANSSASLHTDGIYQETIDIKPSPAIFVYTLPNIMIGEICIRNGFKGEGIFLIQECFDKGFIFECAERQIETGQSVLCLAGWVEVDLEGNYLADLFLLK
jgi:hypothetical protein